MTATERIVRQMQAAFAGGAWHGPSVMEVLKGVDAATASTRPIAGAHSIWALTLHLAATQAIILRRIRGEEVGLNDNEFWEHMPAPTTENWRKLLDRLTQQEAQLQAAVAAFPENRLDDRLMASRETTAYASFHGVVQHNVYHAGQIALLKKAVELQELHRQARSEAGGAGRV
jgi:uncharacterized damage-inducible protein DinB